MRTLLAVIGKIGILGLILIAFAFGLAGTVYLSLRSPNVTVPDVTNKSLNEGESALEATGLSIRERAKRFKSGVQPGVILDQFPRAGSVVKQGQTVAVIVSRAAKEGESVASDEIVEKEETVETASENKNRPRPKPTNRNSNANANTNANNQNTESPNTNGSNANSGGGNTNTGSDTNGNRNSNSGRAANANDNRARNANGRAGNTNGARNANSGRNGNRRPQ